MKQSLIAIRNALQYGRPSNIHIQQIPLPTIDDEDAPVGESGSLSFSYVGMCRLTAVLSSLLPLLENSAEISLTTQRAILVTAVESLDEMSALVDPPGPGQCKYNARMSTHRSIFPTLSPRHHHSRVPNDSRPADTGQDGSTSGQPEAVRTVTRCCTSALRVCRGHRHGSIWGVLGTL